MADKQTKILVVDDDESFLDMLYRFLVDNGYSVEVSINGDKAKTHYNKFLPDIVITDIVMPEE